MDLATQPLSKRADAWLWRLFATGMCFAIFGIGGLLLRVLVFPLLALLPGDARRRRARARHTVSRLF